MSACNTAAVTANAIGAEALSGLARAFFYAGAPALLASHWVVDSNATVSLITKVLEEIKGDDRMERAEALRRSMLALMRTGGCTELAAVTMNSPMGLGGGGDLGRQLALSSCVRKVVPSLARI